MPIPGLTTITVTGTYEDMTGAGQSGSVTFTPTSTLVDASGKIILAQVPIVAGVGGNGQFSVTLPTTDNAGLFPTVWAYNVVVNIPGIAGTQSVFTILLPSSLGSTVDISALSPAPGVFPVTVSAFNSSNTWTAKQTFLGSPSIAMPSGAVSGYVWTASDTAGDGSWQPASGGGGGFQAWQFQPETYGAKGNGKVIYDATISGGSLGTLTSATANFTSADTGKTIVIDGAVSSVTAPLVTTITFVSSTTVTLTVHASVGVTNAYACYGTDDTAAFIACLAAMTSYATAHHYYAEMVLSPLIYMICGPLIQGGATLANAQIPLPVIPASGANPTLVLAFTGVQGGQGAGLFSASGTIPGPDWSGTVLFSTLTGQSYSPTFGSPTMIGGPTPEQGYDGAFTNHWNNVIPVVKGITCIAPVIPTVNMMDFRSCVRMHVEWMRSIVFTSFSSTAGYNSPPAQGAGGLVCPQGGNNAYSYIGSYTAYGFGIGIVVNESVWAGFIGTFLCDTGIYYNESSDGHGVTIGRWAAEANNTHLFVGGGAIGPMPFNVLSMETENISQWTSGFFINDGGNALGGHINISNSTQTGPSLLTGHVIGASNCEIIFQGQATSRGVQTPPAVPSSTTALQNPFWRHAYVLVTGGNVSAIAIDGNVTGLTSGMVMVPSGHSITLTYSVAPTWMWVLL